MEVIIMKNVMYYKAFKQIKNTFIQSLRRVKPSPSNGGQIILVLSEPGLQKSGWLNYD